MVWFQKVGRFTHFVIDFSFFLGKPTIDHSTFATQHSKEEQQQLGDAKNPLHLAFFSRMSL